MEHFDVVVIGGGSAGLGVGYHLRSAGSRFLILERGRVGETWRTQRWDSFTVNTPNWMNVLPGDRYEGDQPDGFAHRDELVAYLAGYADRMALPLREGFTVTGVIPEGDVFRVIGEHRGGAVAEMTAANVVVASGMLRSPRFPGIRDRFPDWVAQLHAADYRSPASLQPGAVVVVGSGQSGCQIAMDLIRGGRDVYLCTSRVGRVRRRYRNRDFMEWAEDMGFWDVKVEDLADPAIEFAPQPQVSGVGRFGSTVSLQSLARDGVRLMGRLLDVDAGVLWTDASLAEHIAFADQFSAEFSAAIDEWIAANGLDAGPVEADPEDEPADPGLADAGLTELDLAASGVGSIVWCTGFSGGFDWIPADVTDVHGRPLHTRGASSVPGLYFVGFPWLRSRKSGIIHGIDEDARFIVDAIAGRMSGAS